ncbi:hypothetical protein LCGC14_1611500 [marine sediment metagenome]|uniref:Phage tail collar domain-containing protein n=1 Tax=marine sediment metagenome TaxID=412755 RepID=A0A0F9IUV3_9ZZZZ
MDLTTPHFQKGMIILWYGPIVLIPTGWQLCDGSSGTPDLRNKFVVGAGDTYNPAATGGTLTHNHAGEATHDHSFLSGSGISAGTDLAVVTSAPNKGGTTGSAGTLPPYYALAYIMKL